MSDYIDEKALEEFRGCVVRKDLAPLIKGGANVPAFVLEYLLANTCSTDDEDKIREGIENVKNVLREHYVNPEESTLIQSKLKEHGKYKIIDKISVELDPQRDCYWANIVNSNIKKANISDQLVRSHEKLLLGGIWAIIDMEYDPMITVGSKVYPFLVNDIKPIQLSNFNMERIAEKRKGFSKEEWKKLLLRSAGYEPDSEGLDERIQDLLLLRLIPLVEANFNMVELGPRSSGKSYIYKEVTPYALLMSGGQGTVAKLFVNNTTGRVGSVGEWDAICFDESTDHLFKDSDAVPLMKDYMESGSFSRGGKGGEISGNASIIYNGNINQPVETVLQNSHLFSPMSSEVNNDTAFLDRINAYLPGWEIKKFAPSNFTTHFGFSTDFFSELLKGLRKDTYYEVVDEFFSLGSHLKQRDAKSVRRIVSGYIKLLHPDGNFTKEEIFVSLPEEKSSALIENVPLAPGVCYSATGDGDHVGIIRIEVVVVPGNGKITITGTTSNAIKEDVKNTVNYIKANEKTILDERHSLKETDLNIQVTNVLGNNTTAGIGGAIYVGILSALYKKNLKAGLAVIGNVTIGGAVERVVQFADKVSSLADNGAKMVIVPMDNISEIATIPTMVLSKCDVPFYNNAQVLLQKAME